MAVELYEHNKKAYLEDKRQIEEAGVSSVVQATGTGKIYIYSNEIHRRLRR